MTLTKAILAINILYRTTPLLIHWTHLLEIQALQDAIQFTFLQNCQEDLDLLNSNAMRIRMLLEITIILKWPVLLSLSLVEQGSSTKTLPNRGIKKQRKNLKENQNSSNLKRNVALLFSRAVSFLRCQLENPLSVVKSMTGFKIMRISLIVTWRTGIMEAANRGAFEAGPSIDRASLLIWSILIPTSLPIFASSSITSRCENSIFCAPSEFCFSGG